MTHKRKERVLSRQTSYMLKSNYGSRDSHIEFPNTKKMRHRTAISGLMASRKGSGEYALDCLHFFHGIPLPESG